MAIGILSLVHELGTLDLPDTALVVGIDDTGDESFANNDHPLFGLGGCAVMAGDYFRYLDDPWHELKGQFFGDPYLQLHASDLRNPTPAQLQALQMFFKNLPFFRFATIASKTVENETIETIVHLVSAIVMQQVANFAKWVQPTEIVFMIENSQRIGKDLLKHFSAYRFGNGEIESSRKCLLRRRMYGHRAWRSLTL